MTEEQLLDILNEHRLLYLELDRLLSEGYKGRLKSQRAEKLLSHHKRIKELTEAANAR